MTAAQESQLEHAAKTNAAVRTLRDERDALVVRRDELLVLVAKLSQSTPLDSEVAEALEQRGVLIAEVGTLRARVTELELELATTRLQAGGPWCMQHGRTWAAGCVACDITRAELAR